MASRRSLSCAALRDLAGCSGCSFEWYRTSSAIQLPTPAAMLWSNNTDLMGPPRLAKREEKVASSGMSRRGSKPSSDMGGDAVTSPGTSLMRPKRRGSVYARAMPLSNVTTSLANRGGQLSTSTTNALYFIAPFPLMEKAPVMPRWNSGETVPPFMSHHMCFPRRCAAVRVFPFRHEMNAFCSTSLKIFSS